jgi:UDP-3-O-[3-hydroxymyristoyl] glucosamine N-acyltransferase
MNGGSVGENCIIGANTYFGHETVIGDNTLLYPNVTVRERCEIGKRVIIHSNTVIGSDGFGYIPGKEGHKKIPQVGIVAIHNDVELGSNVSIDRARFGATTIGEGTKIDNLVQVAHNVIIGKHCFIVSMVVFAGSVEIGDFVTIAGQAAISGHLQVGSGCTILGKAGVTRDLKPGEVVMGMPATSRKEFVSERMQIRKIVKLEQRLKDLESRFQD